MKKLLALLFALIVSLGVVAPALAYDGITGQVRDSKTSQPWQWGGDVYIRNLDTNSIVATCMLDPADGQIIGGAGPVPCDFGSSAIFAPTAPTPLTGASLEVVIDFSCAISKNCSGGSDGTPVPATVPSIPFVQDGTGDMYPLGTVLTGTGPNAVQLAGMNGASGLGISFVLALVAGGSLLMKSKVNKKSESAYVAPDVVYEGELEVQAGSPLGDLTDDLLSDDL